MQIIRRKSPEALLYALGAKTLMRKDIQGLRAIAVGIVLLFHLWPNRFTGGYVGVDVFFVISGFLITLHLLTKPPVTKRALLDFWARRVRRLLPAATLVLLVTLAASVIWLPETMVSTAAREATRAALYVENWELASSSTDYLQSEDAPSPIQHYWSLSVEEQFYLFWPVLIGGLVAFSIRFGKSKQKALGYGLAAVFTLSLAYSVYLTGADSAAAYFVTPTRVWELALGGLVALAFIRWQRPIKRDIMASILAWVGLAMIALAALTFDELTAFPGYTAMLPTVGTALVILAATDQVKWSPRRLLGWKPSQFVGDVSYSVYLWHWPLIIIAPYALGMDFLTLPAKLAVALAALVLAAITKVLVEDPVRMSKYLNAKLKRTYLFGALSIVSVVAFGSVVMSANQAAADKSSSAVESALSSNEPCTGVGAITNPECQPAGTRLLTSPSFAKSDKPVLYADDCWSNRPFSEHKICNYGAENSDVKVALVGNSHAGHWFPPIEKVVNEKGWKLDTYLVSECYTVEATISFGTSELRDNCRGWNEWAVSSINTAKYDLVIISNRTFQPLANVSIADQQEVATSEYVKTLRRLSESGASMLVLKDVPTPTGNVPDCVAEHKNNYAEKCSRPASEAIKTDPMVEATTRLKLPSVMSLDLSDKLCRDGTCYTVVGGVIAYFDHGHLTETFSLELYPYFKSAIQRAVDAKG